MFELMQRQKICLTVETSTMKPLKILRFVCHFQEEVACESCFKHSTFTELTLSWSSLLKGLGLTVIFWTLGFDYVKTIK